MVNNATGYPSVSFDSYYFKTRDFSNHFNVSIGYYNIFLNMM